MRIFDIKKSTSNRRILKIIQFFDDFEYYAGLCDCRKCSKQGNHSYKKLRNWKKYRKTQYKVR